MRCIVALLLLTALTSCARFGVQYADGEEMQADRHPHPTSKLLHRTYLIGDAGNAAPDQTPSVLAFLRGHLASADSASTVLFLGDNIYPHGFPEPNSPDRPLAEHRLDVQVAAVRDFPGRVIWVPGNHDWYTYGLDGLRRERAYLRERTGREDIWKPRIGCGGPEVVEVADDLVYLILDTQWYLTNWKRHPGVNEGCAATNRTEFIRLFREAIKQHREKNVVVVMHHPMATYGRHGGYFTVKDHLTPLPVLGSVLPFVRGNVGTRQDNLNARFQDLRQQLVRIAKVYGNATFVSGHEHNLQYIERNRQRYIVSGAGSKTGPSGMGEGSLFAYGGAGYAVLDLHANGSLWASFFAVAEDGSGQELLYRKMVESPTAEELYEAPETYTDYPITQDRLNAQLVRDDYDRGAFGRLILGDHYRDAYGQSLDISLLDLATYKGGLTPIKKGGGSQTVTLRLRAKDGREYTMRSLDKDPTATIGVRLSRSKIIQKLVEDGFTAAHPIGALPVIGLAEAAGLNHTNPRVFYVPEQPALGEYNPQFGEKVYLIEERPDDEDWMSYQDFGQPRDIRSTRQAVATLLDKPNHVIDYRAVTRARLFDLLIGDWDRHDDQWRWVPEKRADGFTYYVPIPRDRDQAFSHYDGVLLGVTRRIIPDVSPLQPFRAKPTKIGASTRSARFFDATFLSGMTREMALSEARNLRAALTDEVIERAFTDVWPRSMMALNGEEIIAKLKSRRDRLTEVAETFYAFRAKAVDVIGTDNDDVIDVDVLPSGDVTVRLTRAHPQPDDPHAPYYERTFRKQETDEVIIYALAGKDRFVFTGQGKPGPRLRLVGGPDADTVVNAAGDMLRLGKVRYYDYTTDTEPTTLPANTALRDRRAPDAKYNTYSRLSDNRDVDFRSLLPILGRNPDNGILLGATASFTTYGFKKQPFATRQVLNGRYASETGGFRFGYRGEFTDVFGDKELLIEARAQTSLYGVNFYGFGNETDNPEARGEKDRNFNRVRQQYIDFSPQIMKRLNPAASYAFGPRYYVIETTRTPGRFLAEFSDDAEDEGVFSNYHYLGLNGRFEFDNRIPVTMPGRGIRFYVEGGYQLALAGPGESFPRFRADLTFNQKLDSYGDLVLANRVGYTQVYADSLAYWQAATLGGGGQLQNIRGFRQERFSGDRALWSNTDLRYRIFSTRNSNLPFGFGVLVGGDLGRVWLKGEESDRWHYSYGGGVFISPLDYATLSLGYFVGDGQVGRFTFDSGFFF